ncbi:MAG: fibronectin type III domain-containing protein [Thermoguttaceae bacterium]|nr:fibronectin type III domain-containing protein [Thermoguttaceae bacterium]
MNNKQKTPRSRVLSFENLENRELLSVSPVVAAAMEATNLDRAALLGEANVDSNYPGPIQFTLPDEADVYTLSNAVVDGGVVLTQPKITSSSSTTKTITVNWNADAAAAGYEIYYNITTDKTNVSSLAVDSAQTSATITNLEPSASYYVRVVALGDGVTTSDSPAKSYKTIKTQALATLTQPTITVNATTTHTIDFSWSASDGAVSYDVQYRKSTDKAFTTIENYGDTSMTLTDLDAGASYVVKVIANGDYDTTKDSAATKSKTIKTVALQKLAQPKITTFASEMHSIDFAWNAVDNASGYEVQYRKSSEKTFTTYEGEITGTSLTINELDPNTSYYVRVIAKGDGDITGDSATKSSKTIKTKPLITLAKPTIASVQTSDSSLTVNWNAIADAANVSVICKRNGTSEKQTFAVDPNSTRLTITGLVSGAKYTVSVVANGDYITTANSPTSAAKTVTLPKFLKAESPAIVNGSTTAHSITFGWEKVDVAARYEISYGEVNGKTPTVISVAATETAYTIAGLEPNKSYYIQTRAIGDNGYANSDYCQPVVFTTLEQAQLAVPTNLRGAVGANSVDLLWDVVNGAASYTIMFGPEGGQDSSLVTLEDASTSYRITGLDPATSYVFQVRANGDGDSIYSSEFSNPYVVTTLDLAPLDAPQATVAARTTSLLTIEWQPVANATGFTVVYGLTGQSGTTTERLPADATSFTLSGLQPTTSVTFKVTAEGDDVEYASSAATEITAATQTKLGAPMATLVGRTTSSIEIGWLAVSNAQGYTVVYGRTGDTETQTAYLEANETGFILDDVAGTTPYTFLVYADGDDDYATSDAGEITVAALGQLAAPTLTATRAPDSITIAWDANENADGYTVSYGKTGETPSTTFITDATEFTLPTTGESAYYEFSVVAEGSGDYVSSTPSMISVATMVKLTPPNVTATRTLNTISLEWSADANAQSYMLTYGKTGENGLTIWFDATTTKYAFAGLDSATEYTFQLVAVGDEVDYVSSDATVVAISTQDQLAALTIVADRGLNSITLSWDADENATAYELVYGEAGSSETTTVTVTDFATPYVVDGLKAATSYAFSLTALSDDDYYASSNASDITVATQTKLNAPVLSVASRTDSSIVFAWKPIANASGYSATLDNSETPIFINSDETSFVFENLDPGTEHTLTIVAEGDGDNFVTSEATTLDAETLGKLATPTLRFISDVDGITVEWDAVDDATGYLLAYGLTNGDKTTVVTLESFEKGYGVTGLESASNYTFTLTALGDGENYVDSEPATDAENTLGKLDKPVAEVLDRALDAITIGWEPVDDANGYMLLCNEEIVYTGTATSHTVEDLDAGCVYTFELVALGDGDYVNSDATEISAATQTQLSTPVIIATSSDSAIAIAWSPVANATGYQLVFGDQEQIANLSFDQTSYVLIALDADKTYKFKLKAVGDDGDYADSEFATEEVDTLAKLAKPELTVGARTTNSITLEWDENIDASGYTLVYGKSGDTATLSTSIAANETSYVVSGLESGASYTFQLVAEGNDGESVSSDEATTQATTQVQLAAPAVDVDGVVRKLDSITIAWDAVDGASGYALELDGEELYSGEGTSFKVENLDSAESFTFQIKALGEVNGDYADSVATEYTVATLTQLDQPELYAAAVSTNSTISLAWNPVPNATGYTLVCDGEPIASLGAYETSYVATSLDAGTEYTFVLTAEGDDDYVAATSEEATFATLVKLDAPTEFKATGRTLDTITLAWKAVDDVASYTLVYGKSGDTATLSTSISSNEASYVVSGLESGASYTFQLVAEGDDFENVSSDEATTQVTTQVQLDAPTLSVEARSTNSITVEWDKDANASGYALYLNDAAVDAKLTTDDESYTFTPLADGTSYAFQIKALGEVDYADSALSEKFYFSTQATLATPELTATALSDTEIALAWKSVANASKYELVYGDKTEVFEADETSFVATLPNAGTSYTFTLTALGDDRDYVDSAAATATAATLVKLATPNLTVDSRATDSVKLAWGAVAGASGYTLSYTLKDSVATTTVPIVKGATSYEVTGLTSGATYTFELVAEGEANTSVASDAATTGEVATLVKLNAPANVKLVEQTTSSFKIVWDGDERAENYLVSVNGIPEEDPITATEFSMTGLPQVSSYTIEIVANAPAASENYVNSEPASINVSTLGKLATPNVTSKVRTENSISFAWDAVSNASGYTLVFGKEGATPQTLKLGAATTQYEFTDLKLGTTYTFELSADADGFIGSDANEFSVVTKDNLATPTVTSIVRSLDQNETPDVLTDDKATIEFVWGAVENATSYKFYQDGELIYAGDATTKTITGLTPAKKYVFKLEAYGPQNEAVDEAFYNSSSSDNIEVTTQAKLAAPTLNYEARTTDTITVAWAKNDDADSYQLEYSPKGTEIWRPVSSDAFALNGTTYTCVVGQQVEEGVYVGGQLQPGTEYDFRLVAKGENDSEPDFIDSEYSATLTQKTQKQLDAPTQLTVARALDTNNVASVTVSWGVVANASSYEVEYRQHVDEGQENAWSQPVSTNETSYTITNLTPATQYDFRIVAKGEVEDPDYVASEAAETTDATRAKLATPTNVTTEHDLTSISLAWDAVDHAVKYAITYGVTDSGTTTTIEVDSPQFSIGGKASGVSYTFVITAVGDGDYYVDSEPTAAIVAQTQAKLVANAPTLDVRTTTSIAVKWNAVDHATGYTLYKDEQAIEVGNVTSYAITGLAEGTEYSFKIVAKGDEGNDVVNYFTSDPSATVNLKTQRTLATPTLTYASRTTRSIAVDWTATADSVALSYKLEYREKDADQWTEVKVETGTSYPVANLTPGTTYEFQITAVGDGSSENLNPDFLDSATSAVFTKNTQLELAAPTLTLAAQSTESVTISWNEKDNATGYALYRNGSSSPIATLTSGQSTYEDNVKELAPGSSYSYQIVAKGNASSVEDPNDPDFYDSGKSATLTITKLTAPVITVGERTTDSITISWSVAENAAGRTLAYRQAGATAWTKIDLAPLDEANEGEPVTSYTFANLAGNATEYEFQVVALGNVASNTVSSEATETASTKRQLAAPTGLSVSSRGLDTTDDVASLEVSWTASANAPTDDTTTYTVSYQTDGETAKTETGISGTSTTLAGLTPGKNYTIQVVAVSTNDEYVSSASSTAITATTQAMLAVPELAFSERTTNSVTLVWNENTNVREYVLTCKTGGNTVDSFTLGSSSKGFKVSLGAGKTYQFELVAKGDKVQTDPDYYDSKTATLTVATKDTLAAPTLTCQSDTSNPDLFTINWEGVDHAVSYELYLEGETDPVAVKNAGDDLSYVQQNLEAGKSYSFKVIAKGNDSESSNPEVTSYLDSAESSPLVVTKLAAPVITVGERTEASVAVSWGSVANATGFALAYRKSDASEWTNVDQEFGADATSYTFTGLDGNATEYEFQVVALGDVASNTVSSEATETASTKTQLAAPTGLSVSSRGLDTTNDVASLEVSWTASTNADSYTLTYVNQNDASDNGSFTTDDASTTSYTIPNLKSGSTYLVRIVANGSGEFVSSALNEITAKTQAKLDRPVVTIGERTESSLAVSWTASANASSYTLVYNGVEVNNIEDTSYVLEDLTGNTTYEIQIVANPASDDYVASSSVAINAKTKTKLATPTLQYASRGTNSIEVSIANVDGATSYVLSYVNTEDATDAGTATTATLTGLKEGATYSIKVVAKGPANDYVDSDESDALTITTQTQLVMSEVEAKSALNAEGTRASLTFSWDSVANADGGYLIEYRVAGTEGDWTPANPVAAGITTETVNGLEPKTTYEFRAMALASNGADDPSASYYLDSAWSESKTITTLEKLAAIDITGISTGNATSGTVDLSWTSVANAIGYVVSYAETGSTAATETSLISGGDGTTMSYTLTGLKAERTYDIRIKAVGDHENYNDSDYSAAVSATTTRGATVAPTELTAAATATTVTLTWTAAENAAGYEIQDGDGNKLGETTETTITLAEGFSPSMSYTFKVKTLGETGYDDSADLATATVTTQAQTQLAAPTNLTLSIPKDSGNEPVVDAISANWDAVEGAQSYTLSYYLEGDSANAQTVEATTNSAVIEGLQEGKTYVVQVRANGAENDDTTLPSDFSSPAEVATATTLATPIFTQVEKDITSNSGGASLKVTWEASEGATSYLLVCKQNGVVKTSVNVTDGLTGTLNGLDGGREYTIELYAKGENYRTSTPAVINNVKTQEMLATPSNISGTRNGNNNNRTFTFTWTGDARATGYRVWYRTSNTGAYNEVTNLVTSTTWTSGTLRGATNCYVKVQAVYSGPNTDLVDSIEAEGSTQY